MLVIKLFIKISSLCSLCEQGHSDLDNPTTPANNADLPRPGEEEEGCVACLRAACLSMEGCCLLLRGLHACALLTCITPPLPLMPSPHVDSLHPAPRFGDDEYRVGSATPPKHVLQQLAQGIKRLSM